MGVTSQERSSKQSLEASGALSGELEGLMVPEDSETPQCEEDCFHSFQPIHPNVALVHRNSRKAQVTSLATLLKSMIMMKYNREDRDPSEKPLEGEALSEYGNEQLHHLVEEVVEFCNDAARSGKLVERLEDVCKSENSISRNEALATGLNSILVDFHSRNIGRLKKCRPEDLVLYNAGSNMALDSTLLLEVSDHKSKAKPDVYESRYNDLLKAAPEFLGLTFEQLAALMEKEQIKWAEVDRRSAPTFRTQWSDLISCIEVSKGRDEWAGSLRQKWEQRCYTTRASFSNDMPHHFMSLQELGSQSSPEVPQLAPLDSRNGASESSQGTLKRGREESSIDDEPSSKSSKLSATDDEEEIPLGSVYPGRLPAEVQCGFYGLEILRSSWERTHSIVLLLSGDRFSLRWYDSQGCIRTRAVSLCGDELPLVVAAIALFQRFKNPMWGKASVELRATIDGTEIPFGVPEGTRARWEPHGGRVAAVRPVSPDRAPLTPAMGCDTTPPSDSANVSVEDCFFKWSWREATCKSEKTIVDTAKARAMKYLPREHVSDVVDYLPEIYDSKVWEHLSTRHIRECSQLDTSGALVPFAMLSKRLESMETAFSADEAHSQIWDILRCLTLLSALGISHGDVSLGNIMAARPSEGGEKRMVLNDFDLAVVLKPGGLLPVDDDSAHSGTKPFMPMELLNSGAIQRLPRHDVEFALWSLVWYCDRQWDWNVGTYEEVFSKKLKWMLTLRKNQTPTRIAANHADLWKAATFCLFKAYLTSVKEQLINYDLPPRSLKDVLEACEVTFPRKEKYTTWAWMDFVVKEDNL
ncbi:hypothetical protein DFP72DRAFT_1111320 [Ephemerocybe angulata]|uniref:Fungal-type protein kinase domain-containing protein n=1 Tax=Ephemerocybe angulata TaxID=980116 RepID=A0A8H6MAR9_9AGAR|nr:hypothetical protein DFP72DRAFT_1111320 [Tulosesus angulatus]